MNKSLPLIESDPLLKPFGSIITKRNQRSILRELEFTDGKIPLKDIVNNHLYYGLQKGKTSWILREKAPKAKQVFVYGDFSYWNIEERFSLHPIGNGDWEIELPLPFLRHGLLYKLWVVWQDGADERLPSHVQRVVQDNKTKIFSAQVWDPPTPYRWKNPAPKRPETPLIYEAHIGMSSEKAEPASYWSFKENILPRIQSLGYNTIQLMAIQEHPYYGSFGYQVSNFYAPSSRFGTPEELMELIDQAHGMGLYVILDLIHSHAVSNVKEGISHIDGSDHLYFHSGNRGTHPVWDSRCFNYGTSETLLFLLSNLKYWLEQFHFDGFRFDGITSMMYVNHGIGVDFVDYKQYFDDNVDEDAIVYLTLANQIIKQINPKSMVIAEDVSGMPGLAYPILGGGIGFDYRMSMGIADFWTQNIKTLADEEWNVGDIFFRLTDKRKDEQTISYVESHDQAMVGDQTIISQLIGKEIYTAMNIDSGNSIVERGVAFHKILRFLTATLAQGGYLNFMGNEFGHPEWIDFPREGNGWSYHYARRQWSLSENPTLFYYYLNRFDAALISFIAQKQLLKTPVELSVQNREDQVLSYRRKNILFIANLNPIRSYPNYEISCESGIYKIVLNSDSSYFQGYNRLNEEIEYRSYRRDGEIYLKLYIPNRTVFALERIETNE